MTTTSSGMLTSILSSRDLPTLPTVASKLLTLTAQEETPLAEIAALIAQDMALTAKILRVANSSFYSFSKNIKSIQHAVSILGTNPVRSLVLSFSFLSMRNGKNANFDHSGFWERSLAGAAAAKVIAEQLPETDSEEHFTIGLLQNIGHLVFASTLPGKFETIHCNASASYEDIDEEITEEAQLGITHSAAGYEVAKKWGLPDLYLHAIRFHHKPTSYAGSDKQCAKTGKIVFLADLIVSIFYSATPEIAHKRFRKEAKELFGLDVLTINAVLKQVANEIDASAEYFGLNIPPTKSVAEILQEANSRLNQLNLSYEELNRELIKSKRELEQLTAELKQKNNQLRDLANVDHLTEIANHRFFQTILDQELNRSARNEGTISILMMDIDWFKKVNDTWGHPTGDFILKEFCSITKNIIRDYDLLARYGGEEFIAILPATAPEDAVTVAEKIRKNIENHVFNDGTADIRITVSIGVASAHPAVREIKKQTLISYADEALYQAKRTGRNRVIRHHHARNNEQLECGSTKGLQTSS
ncbi:MAG: GGDEF domain-containing protein [Desulfobulbus sp.]|nr:GGDEF domain-containing protein [Desulfobulbus sp.]